MNKSKNVLSLFDGISCGQVALKRAGIKFNKYYSSEIDKHVMKVTDTNHPNTIQLGDIKNWKKWKIDWSSIGLILAGFPCQDWSVAGKMQGDNDSRGALVHDLIAVWKKVKKHNPNVKFIFENVKMKKEFIKYISELFGVEPIEINSALLSAQHRRRLYWTNIKNVVQPEDKKIFIKNVIGWSKSTRYPKKGDKYIEQRVRADGKANTLTTGSGCSTMSSTTYKVGNKDKYMTKAWLTWWNENYEKQLTKKYSFILNQQEKAICLTARQYSSWNGNYICRKKKTAKKYRDGGKVLVKISDIRKLTTNECEFLQTLPDNYTSMVSDSQRYKAIGNGWTVDVVAHIMKKMKQKKKLLKRY